jgi:hypothetical protein
VSAVMRAASECSEEGGGQQVTTEVKASLNGSICGEKGGE